MTALGGCSGPDGIRALVAPTVRSLEWVGPAVGYSSALLLHAGAIMLAGVLPPPTALGTLRVGMVLLALGAAVATPDPAETTLEATPAGRRRRWLLRGTPLFLAWTLGWASLLGLSLFVADGLSPAALTVEAAGWLSLCLVTVRLLGSRAAVATALALATLLRHLPERIEIEPSSQAWSTPHERWLGLGALAAAVVVWSLRDPPRG